MDPSNLNTLYHTDYQTIERSDNAGQTWQTKDNGINKIDRSIFMPPMAIDTLNPQTVYFGTHRLYRSTNRADSWSPITGDLTSGGYAISAIAVAPNSSVTIYVGTSNGNLQVVQPPFVTPIGKLEFWLKTVPVLI